MIKIHSNFFPIDICFTHALSGAAIGKINSSCFSPIPSTFYWYCIHGESEIGIVKVNLSDL